MARSPKRAREKSQISADQPSSTAAILPRPKALVFISHDTRDNEIAEAFSNLLIDVSVGTLKTFRSSDNLGTTGIAFGDEWYDAITSKLGEATDVVALLTATSIDRPWILYEAGIAAGKLNTRVIGVAIGLPLSKAITGPFSQFQNSADDEQSLTKLMLQLLQRNPDAAPRPETVAIHVKTFREKIATILKSKGGEEASTSPSEEENVAILVEEIKGMLRELPDRLGDRHFSRKSGTRNRHLNLQIMESVAYGFRRFEHGAALSFITILSMLRDDVPWLYEPGREFYKLATSKSRVGIKRAAHQMHELVEFSIRGPLRESIDDEDKIRFATRILHDLIEGVVSEQAKVRSTAKGKVELQQDD